MVELLDSLEVWDGGGDTLLGTNCGMYLWMDCWGIHEGGICGIGVVVDKLLRGNCGVGFGV